MRAIWKGAVSFGLVSIAVKLYSATEEKDIRFHQVHRDDGGRIKYKRVCSIDGEEVSYDDIAKGYDLGGGEMVILTDDDFADLPLTTQPGDRGAGVRAGRAGRPDPLQQGVLPGARQDRRQAVRAAARRADETGPGRDREGGAAAAGAARDAAGPRGRPGAQHHAVAGRDPRCRTSTSSTRTSRRARRSWRWPARSSTRWPADFDPDELHRQLPRGAAGGHRRQGRAAGRSSQPEETEEAPAAAVDLMAALRASVERARASRARKDRRSSPRDQLGPLPPRRGRGGAGRREAGQEDGEEASQRRAAAPESPLDSGPPDARLDHYGAPP